MYTPPIIIDAKELGSPETKKKVPKTAGNAGGGILGETNDNALAEPGDTGEAVQPDKAPEACKASGGIGEATQSDKTVVPEVSNGIGAGEATQVDFGGWFPLLEWSTLRENRKYQYMAYTTQIGQPVLFFEPVIFIDYQDECLNFSDLDGTWTWAARDESCRNLYSPQDHSWKHSLAWGVRYICL